MAKILELHNTNLSPATDMQLSLGRYGCAWNELWVAGQSNLWNTVLEGWLDIGDNNLYSMNTLYGVSSNNYIDMSVDGRINIAAIASGTPYSTPDITLSGSVYIDDNVGLYTTKKLYFRDTTLYICSDSDGYLDIYADTRIDLNAPVYLGTNSLTSLGSISARGYYLNTVLKTGDYVATNSDDIILCNALSNNITITLPPASTVNNKILIIKAMDIGSAYSILIETNSSEFIDGVDDITITTDYQTVRLVAYGNSWYII
jgi:hypothetical protein